MTENQYEETLYALGAKNVTTPTQEFNRTTAFKLPTGQVVAEYKSGYIRRNLFQEDLPYGKLLIKKKEIIDSKMKPDYLEKKYKNYIHKIIGSDIKDVTYDKELQTMLKTKDIDWNNLQDDPRRLDVISRIKDLGVQ